MKSSRGVSCGVSVVGSTHHEYGRGGSGTPDTIVEPSGGAVGLFQQNADEGRRLLDKPQLYPAALVLWLGSCYIG